MKKKAFTLLELLIVITIIGVLTATLVVDFVGVRQRQELLLMTDQAVAMLQQARSEVSAGKVTRETEADGSETVTFLCEGAYFEVGAAPLWAYGDYDSESESCLYSSLVSEPYGLSTGEAYTESIEVGGVPAESLWVLYTPPESEVKFFPGDREDVLSGDAVISFNHSTEQEEDISITVSSLTHLVTLSIEAANEEE